MKLHNDGLPKPEVTGTRLIVETLPSQRLQIARCSRFYKGSLAGKLHWRLEGGTPLSSERVLQWCYLTDAWAVIGALTKTQGKELA